MTQTTSSYFTKATPTTKADVKYFTAVLTGVTAKDNGKALLTFAIEGHPHRNEYSKEVSLKYMEDMFEIFNSYLAAPLQEFNPDSLINALLTEKPVLHMWSKSFFDKAQNKYRTDSSFMGK